MRVTSALLLISLALVGCSDGATGPPAAAGADLELQLHRLPVLDPEREGVYEAWLVDAAGAIHSAGRFQPPADGRVALPAPVAEAEYAMLTVEPPGDEDDQPSQQKLLGGELRGGTAQLDVNRYVTAGIPLEAEPGTHVLFTPSDNGELGYPSNEDSGIWLFNIRGDTIDSSFYLTFTPLTRGWMYEGWVVRDHGTADEIWLSYGKFEPDNFRKQRSRDNTGVGPFSGQIDYERWNPTEIVMPGDDWVANPHGYPVPGGLELPLDLNGNARSGAPSRWTHVITIEPQTEEDEDAWAARPFLLRPYRNPIGEAAADVPRTVEYVPDGLPRATAALRPRG